LRSAGKKANFGAVKICLFAQIEHQSKINPAKSSEAAGVGGENTKNQTMSGGRKIVCFL
jgi:hypothetical protein